MKISSASKQLCRSALAANSVVIFDSSPRDGIQAIDKKIPTKAKVELARNIYLSGVNNIEVGSVSNLPQMSDSKEVFKQFSAMKEGIPWVLIANKRGMDEAYSWGCRHFGLMGAASEEFSLANTNKGIEASFADRQSAVLEEAARQSLAIRTYVSCCFGYRTPDDVPMEQALDICERFYRRGSKVVVCDTMGHALPFRVNAFIQALFRRGVPKEMIAVHFHGTEEEAIANVREAFKLGVREVDTSLKGLGGCPVAKKILKKEINNAPLDAVTALSRQMGLIVPIDNGQVSASRRMFFGHM